ncbi:hypothetical protein ABPG72_020904 [Tetrahymena utriculariae]
MLQQINLVPNYKQRKDVKVKKQIVIEYQDIIKATQAIQDRQLTQAKYLQPSGIYSFPKYYKPKKKIYQIKFQIIALETINLKLIHSKANELIFLAKIVQIHPKFNRSRITKVVLQAFTEKNPKTINKNLSKQQGNKMAIKYDKQPIQQNFMQTTMLIMSKAQFGIKISEKLNLSDSISKIQSATIDI